jgi:hypothetical protein
VDVQIVLHQHDLLRLRKVRVGYSFEDLGVVHAGDKKHVKADWQFTTTDARVKLKRLYPAPMVSHDRGDHFGSPQIIASTKDASDHPILIADGTEPYLSWLTANEGYRLIPLEAAE